MSGSDAPIRVTLVGPSLDILGGQAVQAQRLLERFEATPGLVPEFLAVNPRLPGPLRLLQRVKYLRTVVTSLAYVIALLWRLPRTNVVHAFSASYWSFLLAPAPAMLIGRLFRRQVVLNYHSGEAEDHLQRWGFLVIPLMRLAHRIVVPSGYLVEVFQKFGLEAEAIPNSLPAVLFQTPHRAATQPCFLSNRNLEPLYNVGATLRAFARIQQEVPEAQLMVLGDGTERIRLEKFVEEHGLRRVTFLGQVAPERMADHLSRAGIYLNSPNIDNMPISILEAFAVGVPVVSTRAGGIPWIVRDGETGLLVDCNDDAAIAASALRLLRDPELAARLASAARAEALARYTWEAVEPQWLRLYGDLVRRESTHP